MFLWLLLSLAGCPRPAPPVVHDASSATEPPVPGGLDPAAGVSSPVLRDLLRRHWDHAMESAPVWATSLGDHRFDDRLPDRSPEAVRRNRAVRDGFLAEARAIDPAGLSAEDRTTLALFVEDLAHDAAADVCRFERWSISPRFNPAVDFNGLVDVHPLDTEADGRTYLARLAAMPEAIGGDVAQLRLGLEDGLVANAESVGRVIAQIEDQLASDPASWPLAAVVGRPRPRWSPDARAAFDAEVVRLLAGPVADALARYVAVLRTEVLPAARGPEAVGLGALPGGDACYAARVRAYTTLPLTPDEVHADGLAEMAAIHDAFRRLGAEVFGTDDLQEIFARLRGDAAPTFDTSDAVQARAEAAVAAARAALPRAFGRLPRADVVVRPVPANEAPYTTIAYYREPAADGSRPGIYYVNTSAPRTRPRHEAEVLAFHEAIPGHHLQIALAQEIPDLPAFRRTMGATAFVEGWALYAEGLADELGLYSSDLDRLGRLSFDAWRAGRLVVDTGIHARGWTRAEAEAYLRENTPLAPNNIANEVDRYITWPGQALAYKTGERFLREVREEAEAALGESFDLRAFHDVVLGGGAVTLPELRRRVEAWVAEEAGR